MLYSLQIPPGHHRTCPDKNTGLTPDTAGHMSSDTSDTRTCVPGHSGHMSPDMVRTLPDTPDTPDSQGSAPGSSDDDRQHPHGQSFVERHLSGRRASNLFTHTLKAHLPYWPPPSLPCKREPAPFPCFSLTSLSVRPVLSTACRQPSARCTSLFSPDNEFGFSIVAYSSSCVR